MLNSSFLHIPSVGKTTERRLWQQGIKTMDDFIVMPPEFIPSNRRRHIVEHVRLSKEKLTDKEPFYFYDNLPSREHWRAFKEFRDSTAYLDIETTGLKASQDIITTIALYDGKNVMHYVNGRNLQQFTNDIRKFKVIVTYNGKAFDIPFIERYFTMSMPHCHLDLMHILHSLGYYGGLKSCERQLGKGRTGSLMDIDGYMAVLLWHDYMNGRNDEALETLLAYNIEDVLNLESLMIHAYNLKLKDIPLELDALDMPEPTDNPFKVSPSTVSRIKNMCGR